MTTGTPLPNWFPTAQQSSLLRWVGLFVIALFAFSMVPKAASGQAKCAAIDEDGSATASSGTWITADWRVDSDGDGDFDTNDNPCPDADGTSFPYPDQDDDAIITADVRLDLDVDLTSSGKGPLSSLTLRKGTEADASGTLLEFTGNDLETTGDVTNNQPVSNNGLILTGTGGTGSLTVGGRFTNDGNITANNNSVKVVVSGQFENQSNGDVNLTGADTLSVGNGIENDGTLTASNIQGIEVTGSTIRNREDLDISSSRLTIGSNSSLAENGTDFNTNSSTVIFSGDDQPISGSGSSGDGTVDIVFDEVILKNGTLVDPAIDVQIDTDLTVNLGSTWGAAGEDAEMDFQGTNFEVLQAQTMSETDAVFRSSQIRFFGSGVTDVQGEVFSQVRVESDLNLTADFEVDGFYEHLTSTVTVGSTNKLDLEQDAEINGTLTVNGTLQFSGLGGTSEGIPPGDGGDNSVQDVQGTGDFVFSGLEILGSGTDVVVRRTQGRSLDVGTLFIEGTADGLSSDASLDVTSDVIVSGDLTANGDFTLAGKLTMDGSGGQDLIASNPLALDVLESANGSSQDLKLGSGTEVRIIDILELEAGTFDVSPGTLTLESSGTSHAVLNYGGGDISGSVVAERELSTGPDWYFLANPEGTTYDSFLRQGNENNFWIQGHTGSDVPSASFQNTNLFEYNEQEADSSQDNGWSRSLISGMSDNADRGRGFIVFPFTDDNNDGNPDGFAKQVNIETNPTTTNSFTFSVTATDRNNATTSDDDNVIDAEEGWNLLGNPYLTNIAWTELDTTNLDGTVYVYQPLSGYQSFNGTTTTDTDSTFDSDGIIGPFQAFFVKAENGTDPSSKSYGLSIPNIQNVQRDSLGGDDPFLKSGGSQRDRILALNAAIDGLTEEAKFTFRPDGILKKDIADAYQLENPGGGLPSRNFLELYSVLPNGNALAINNLPYLPEDKITVPVEPDLRGCDGSEPYVAEATISLGTMQDIPGDWRFVLTDTKTGDEVILSDQSEYIFTLESSTPASECSKMTGATTKASSSSVQSVPTLPSPEVLTETAAKDGSASTRFTLTIDAGSALPVEFNGVNGTVEDQDAILEWETASETNNAGFQVQRKQDGSFTDLEGAFVESKAEGGTTDQPQSYRYRVTDLDAGPHTFRLKQVDLDGTESFSDPMDVEVGLDGPFTLTTYPNPARTQATVEFAVQEEAPVTIELYNTLGQQVRTIYRDTPPAEQTQRVQLQTQTLSSGLYFLRMTGADVSATQQLTVVK